MARSKATIYNSLVQAKNSFASVAGLTPANDNYQLLLNDLNTGSKVGFWRLLFSVITNAIFTLETNWDNFRSEILDIVNKGKIHSYLWYRDQLLKYQHGYQMQYINGSYKYATTDTAAQVINQVAVLNVEGVLRIKLAKENVNGDLEPLTSDELQGARDYVMKIKDAGTNAVVSSEFPDELKLDLLVYYDPAIMNGDGSLVSDAAVFPVVDAIKDYLSSLDFNGIYIPTTLVDFIQNAQGVINPVVRDSQVKVGTASYVSSGDFYATKAGYMIITNDESIANQITYVQHG